MLMAYWRTGAVFAVCWQNKMAMHCGGYLCPCAEPVQISRWLEATHGRLDDDDDDWLAGKQFEAIRN
uniref:Putative secreted peptide n=1 Tax=Anopheles braziliensis TaxID=58242 RepID=A0A2M3ZXK6_9DIPT